MPTSKLCIRLGTVGVRACVPCEHTADQLPAAVRRTVDRVAQALHKAGKISDLCEGAGFFERLTLLERQFPSASVLVHKQGVLPPEIAALWSSPQLMSAARQFLGGGCPGHCVVAHCNAGQLHSMPVHWLWQSGSCLYGPSPLWSSWAVPLSSAHHNREVLVAGAC